MTGEWLGRLALRAYPRDMARSQGPEMLSMAMEMAGDSRLALARELVFLVACGLRERSRVPARHGRRQLVTDACSIALILFLVFPVLGQLSRFGHVVRGPVETPLIALTILVVFGLLLAGYNRWVGIVGLCAIAIGVTITALQGRPPLENVLSPLVTMAVPAVCCAILAIAPGRRPPRLARLWWFTPLVVLAILLPTNTFWGEILGLNYEYALFAAASAIGVLRLAYDPRLVLGCGLVWATIGLRIAYENTVFGFGAQSDTIILWCSALLVAAAAVRLVLMRQQRLT